MRRKFIFIVAPLVALLSFTTFTSAEDAETWRKVETKEGTWPPNVTQTMFDTYVQTYGTDWLQSNYKTGRTY